MAERFMAPFSNEEVAAVFRRYPDGIRPRLMALRQLVYETAARLGISESLEETLKWGEPSYICPTGSTVRVGWNEKEPDCYKLFVHCQSLLVPTFRSLYPNEFTFEGNRAIRFSVDDEVDETRVGHCIELALVYHRCKHLPLLGAQAR